MRDLLLDPPLEPVVSIDLPESPDVSHLITEDDTPVDNLFSEKQQRLLTRPLYVTSKPIRIGLIRCSWD